MIGSKMVIYCCVGWDSPKIDVIGWMFPSNLYVEVLPPPPEPQNLTKFGIKPLKEQLR